MENNRDLRGKSLQRTTLATWGVKEVIGYDFEEVDTIEVLEDSGGKIRTPAETDSVFRGIHALSLRIHRTRRRSHRHRSLPLHHNRRTCHRNCLMKPCLKTMWVEDAKRAAR